MRVRILGTAAAEGWPAVFCRCETCRRARAAGGKDIRSRASVQFGDTHKVDLPPDTWFHEAHLGADLSRLEHLFITHSHGDHWEYRQVHYVFAPFAHERQAPLNIYGNAAVIRLARQFLGENRSDCDLIRLHEIEPFSPIEAGDMAFTPIQAVHMVGSEETCLNYIVASGGKTLLYASDTAWYEEETWKFLEARKFDAVISECTCGPLSGGGGHMDFKQLFAMKERLEKAASILADGIFVATHFSHNVGLLHHELEHVLSEHGIQTAYDGMEITI